ncbi:hypothetical protein ACHAXM_005046, partial [Skeletonema potamos]
MHTDSAKESTPEEVSAPAASSILSSNTETSASSIASSTTAASTASSRPVKSNVSPPNSSLKSHRTCALFSSFI